MSRTPDPEKRPRGAAIPPLPPAGYVEGVNTPSGSGLLSETDETLALCLWRILRDVRTYLETPQEQLAEFFPQVSPLLLERYTTAGRLVPELASPIGVLLTLRRHPSVLEPTIIGSACGRIAEWAESRDLLHTGAAFAEAAARICPEVEAFSFQAARLTRRLALHDRAPVWYQRAYVLARQNKNKEVLIRALLGMAAWHRDVGDLGAAEAALRRAARRATYSGPRPLAAQASHELMNVASERGRNEEAVNYAWEALHLYARKSTRLPYFIHDLAFHLVRAGYCREAATLLRPLVSRFDRPGDSALVWSTLAWALGEIGALSDLRSAEEKVLTFLGWSAEHEAAALVHLAYGVRAIGDQERAVNYARRAIISAARVQDKALESEARQAAEQTTPMPSPVARPTQALLALVRMVLKKAGLR